MFSAVFDNESSDSDVLSLKQRLISSFQSVNVFRNEYAVFYTLTKDIPRIIPNKDFMTIYLQTNRAVFTRSSNIDLSNYSLGDTDPYIEFCNSCLTLFETCLSRKVGTKDFDLALEIFKMQYVNSQSIEILEQSTVILSEGVKIGNKVLSGYQDMRRNIKNKFVSLDNMVSRTDRKGIITYGHNDVSDEEETPIKLVSNFGINKLDKVLGGIYEGDMVSLIAPTKGGKSRISTYMLHNAVVNNGTSIVVWSIENGQKGWEALVRARHFNWLYNSGLTDVTQKRILNSDMIRRGKVSDNLVELEKASWTDLKSNSNYGKITVIDEDFTEDTIFEVLESAINEFGAKLICVDYLQMILGANSELNTQERITSVYQRMLQFVKKKKVGGIFPAQMKQAFFDKMVEKTVDEIANMDFRTAAGSSHEIIKTPDVNLLAYANSDQLSAGELRLYSIPSRNAEPFSPIELFADFGSCTFQSFND